MGSSASGRLSPQLSSQLFVPTAMMPVASHIHSVVGNHHEMEGSGGNRALTAGAQVFLACLIGLNGTDCYVENSAHAMSASVTPTASTTMATSRTELSWERNGLNPMTETVTVCPACLPSPM